MAFPTKQAEINAILQLWKDRLPDHETRYGLNADQIRQQSDDSIIYNHLLTVRSQLNEDVSEVSTYILSATEGNKDLPLADYPTVTILPLPTLQLPPKQGIIPRNTELYNYLKGHPNRTAESLADLGITDPPNNALPPESKKPTLKGAPMIDDRVSITFNKQGMKAVRIQMRRNNGSFTNIGDPTTSPFIDETPSIDGKPEKREYRAIYLDKNEPVGQYSDIITVYSTP